MRSPYVSFRRSNEVVPDPGDAGNQALSEADKEKQGDCQRAKQVLMNMGAGAKRRETLFLRKIPEFSQRTKTYGK